MSRLPANYQEYVVQKETQYLPGYRMVIRVDPSGKGYPVYELLVDNKTPFSLGITLFILAAVLFPGYLLSPALACLLMPFTGTDKEGKPCGWLQLRGADNGLQGIGKLKKYTIATNLIDPSKRLLIAYGGALGFVVAGLLGHNVIVNQLGYRGIETFFGGSGTTSLESESSSTSTGQEPAGSTENNVSETQVTNTFSSNQASIANNSESVSFSGINLPITNNLCNKKRNFCIYNLASLVSSENGEATYTFNEQVNGENVNINGRIYIESVQKEGSSRSFNLRFEDNQSSTTTGWAAAGRFELAQDSKKPGIISKFITTESFGPKTPVGLENTAYLFPSS